MNWFYAKHGEQHGPVSEEELKQLRSAGEIAVTDLVWREGFNDWVTYGSVFEQNFAPAPAARIIIPIPEGRGTGGRTANAELRSAARRALSGKWGSAVVFFLIFFFASDGLRGRSLWWYHFFWSVNAGSS